MRIQCLLFQIKVARDSSDQQRRHPKYQEYVSKQTGFYAPSVPSNVAMVQYGAVPVAAQTMGTGYGGGYGYAMNDAQKAMRGRGTTTRFNPMARPIGTNITGAMQPEPPSNVLFVYNIGPNAQTSDMYMLFSKYGRITKVDVIAEKGYAFVHMPIPAEAAEAIRGLNNQFYNGKYLQVSLKK